MPYSEKIEAYKTENILTKSLTDSFYKNNPKISNFIREVPEIKLESYEEFGKPEIYARGDIYTNISRKIWGKPSNLDVPIA